MVLPVQEKDADPLSKEIKLFICKKLSIKKQSEQEDLYPRKDPQPGLIKVDLKSNTQMKLLQDSGLILYKICAKQVGITYLLSTT
jgi:hypothetical protein